MSTSKKSATVLTAILLAGTLLPLVAILPEAAATGPTQALVTEWFDTDHNGHLDAVGIELATALHAYPGDGAIYPGDFLIAGKPATGFSTRSCIGQPITCDPTALPGAGEENDARFTLFFEEQHNLDAGVSSSGGNFQPPALVYQQHANNLIINAGNPTNGRNDRAPPVIRAAYALAGQSQITVTFSEAVSADGGTQCSGSPPTGVSCFLASPESPSDRFCFVSAGNPSAVPPVPPRVHPVILISAVGNYPSKAFRMTVGMPNQTTPPSAPAYHVSYQLTARDVDVGKLNANPQDSDVWPARLFLGDFTLGSGGANTCNPLTGPAAVPYMDKSGNNGNSGGNPGLFPFCPAPACAVPTPRAPWFGWPLAGLTGGQVTAGLNAVPVGGPIPVNVYASRDNRDVIAEFTGPVADCFGAPLSNSAFQTRNAAGGSSPPNWYVATVDHNLGAIGSDRVVIRSTVPLPDLTSDLVTAPSAIYGAPNLGNDCPTGPAAPGTNWRLSDGPISITGTQTDGNLRGASLSAPRIATMETWDGNSNGCVDAIKVTFTEAMDDGAGTVMQPVRNNFRSSVAGFGVEPHPEFTYLTATSGDSDTLSGLIPSGTVAGDTLLLAGVTTAFTVQLPITGSSIDFSPPYAPGVTPGTRFQIVSTFGAGSDADTLVDPGLGTDARAGDILRITRGSDHYFFRVTGTDNPNRISYGDWATGAASSLNPPIRPGDSYRLSSPSSSITGWNVYWPGYAHSSTTAPGVFAAYPVTGGPGISGSSRILYNPGGLNDKVVFLTFPALNGLQDQSLPYGGPGYATADTDNVPVDLDTYGSTSCHPTGPLDSERTHAEAMPRVSYCANSPGFATGTSPTTHSGPPIRESDAAFGRASNGRVCPDSLGRPRDLAGNQVQFAAFGMLNAGSTGSGGGIGSSGGGFMYRALTLDGSPPTLIAARTRDCGSATFYCPSVEGYAPSYNGRIDAIQLTFSEPLAGTPSYSSWQVTVSGPCTTTGATPSYAPLSIQGSTSDPGRVKFLTVTEIPNAQGYDTACIPDLRFQGAPTVQDLFGQCEGTSGFRGPCPLANTERGPRSASQSVVGPGFAASCGAGCSTTQLQDTAFNFAAAGVEIGDRLLIRSGPAAGAYDVVAPAPTATTVTFSPAAPAAVATGNIIEICRVDIDFCRDPTQNTPGTFVSMGLAQSLRDFCSATTNPDVRSCSPAVTLVAGNTLAAGTYQAQSINTATGAITYVTAGGAGGAVQHPMGIGGSGFQAIELNTVRALNEEDGAGPVLLRLQGTIGSTYAQGTFSERPCGWRSSTAGAAPNSAAPMTSLILSGGGGVDLSWYRAGVPLAITGTNGAQGMYKVTAVTGTLPGPMTLYFAPAAPVPVTSANAVLVGCQANQAADFAYQDNNGSGTALIDVPSHSTPAGCTTVACDNKLDFTLAPSTGLTQSDVEGDAGGQIKDCLQLKVPTETQYAPGATTFAVTDMSSNVPHPEKTNDGTPCRYWDASGVEMVSAETQDSNKDGYLDAVKVRLSQTIRDGSRLLRRDLGPSGTCTAPAPDNIANQYDAIYLDRDAVGASGFGVVDGNTAGEGGDLRLTACGATLAGVVDCETTPTAAVDPDCTGVTLDTNYPILWQDVAALTTATSGVDAADGLWADVDSSNSVTHGDFRYRMQAPAGGLAAGTEVACGSTFDLDCGRAIQSFQDPCPNAKAPACYRDMDGNGWVSNGDFRNPEYTGGGAAFAEPGVGAVNCNANPDPDCGTGFTPTTVNLAAPDFHLTISPSRKVLVPACVVTGKGPGPLLGGTTYSSCPGGIVGTPDPIGGAVPIFGDSCAGPLASSPNDDVFFVCFPVWTSDPVASATPPIPARPIWDTGYRPEIGYSPSTTRPGGTIRSLETDVPLGAFGTVQDPVITADGAAPVLVEALASPGSASASLRWSEPVASGSKSTTPIAYDDLAYVNGNGGTSYCPSGVNNLQSPLGNVLPPPASQPTWGATSYVVPVPFVGRLSHEDVVGCIQNPLPASQVPARDGIRPAVGRVFERDCDVGVRATCAAILKTVPFLDKDLGPQVDTASFIDADGDGSIDAVKVVFTEPVNDCFMSVGQPAGGGDPVVGPTNPFNGLNPAFPIGPVKCDVASLPDGTSSAGGTATTLADSTAAFAADGVTPGRGLVIYNGPAAGTYVVTGVAANTLTFSPAAPAPVGAGALYSVVDATHAYGWMPTAASHRGDFKVKVNMGAGATQELTIRAIVTGQLGASGPFAGPELCREHYDIANPANPNPPPGTYAWPALTLHAGENAPTTGARDGFMDNVVFLCLNPDARPGDGGHGTKGLATDATGTFLYTQPGNQCGNASDAGAVNRPICDIADIGPEPMWLVPPNAMRSMDPAITLGDQARPAVLAVTTDDRDHNGKVDSVRLNVSEPIDVKTLKLNDWNIDGGRTITGFALPSASATCNADPSRLPAGTPSANHFWLCFAEVAGTSTFDTGLGHTPGTGPRVSYAGGGDARDRAACARPGTGGPCNNTLRAMTARVATDGAPPVVVRLQSTEGSATSTITFSEPVQGTGDENNPALSIVSTNLYYQDANPGGTGASAITDQVVHSPGDVAAAVTLNRPVTAEDLRGDKICFVGGAIREAGGPKGTGLALYDTCFAINGVAGDRTPPPAPSEFKVTGITGNTINLEWKTPDDPDVKQVSIYVCNTSDTNCKMDAATVRLGTGLTQLTGMPRTAGKGTEAYAYTAAPNWAALRFGVVTIDGNGNIGGPAVIDEVKRPDTIAPEAIGSIVPDGKSPDGDRVKLTFNAPHNDGNQGGKVTGYEVYKVVGAGPIQAIPANLVSAAAVQSTGIADPGQPQALTVTGLTTNTTYTFAVLGTDGRNTAALTAGAQATVRTEATQPKCVPPLVGTPPDCVLPDVVTPAQIGVCNTAVKLTVASNAPVATTGTATTGTGTTTSPTTTAAAPAGNRLTWTVGGNCTVQKDIKGFQVWRCDTAGANCRIVANLSAATRSYVDATGDADDTYLVTSFFGDTVADGRAQRNTDSAQLPSFTKLEAQGRGGAGGGKIFGLDTWVVIAIAAALLLAIILAVALLMRRGRGGATLAPPEQTPPGDEWAAAEGEGAQAMPADGGPPAGPGDVPPPGGAPAEPMAAAAATSAAEQPARSDPMTHYVTCPKCSTEFSARGSKPLAIQCPNCGVRGTLR